VPFICSKCDEEHTLVFDAQKCRAPVLEGQRCPACGAALEFDDVPESYFAFVRFSRLGT
jgi:hypothetical protein